MTMDNHAARKAAVYEAALQLIARGVSPAAMTIQQLADTAGIGKGTVYGYFSSKEEILQGLAEYCFARENERIRVLFADCCTLAGLECGRAAGHRAHAAHTPAGCGGDRPRGKSGILLHRDLFRRCRRPDRAVLYRGVRDTERPAGEFKNAAASDITSAAIKSSP